MAGGCGEIVYLIGFQIIEEDVWNIVTDRGEGDSIAIRRPGRIKIAAGGGVEGGKTAAIGIDKE